MTSGGPQAQPIRHPVIAYVLEHDPVTTTFSLPNVEAESGGAS